MDNILKIILSWVTYYTGIDFLYNEVNSFINIGNDMANTTYNYMEKMTDVKIINEMEIDDKLFNILESIGRLDQDEIDLINSIFDEKLLEKYYIPEIKDNKELKEIIRELLKNFNEDQVNKKGYQIVRDYDEKMKLLSKKILSYPIQLIIKTAEK